MQAGSVLIYIIPLFPIVLSGMCLVAINANKILDVIPNISSTKRIWHGYALMLILAILIVGYSAPAFYIFVDQLVLYLLFIYGMAVIIGFPIVFILKKIKFNYSLIIIIFVTFVIVALYAVVNFTKHYSTEIALRNWFNGLEGVIIQSILVTFAFCIGSKVSFLKK